MLVSAEAKLRKGMKVWIRACERRNKALCSKIALRRLLKVFIMYIMCAEVAAYIKRNKTKIDIVCYHLWCAIYIKRIKTKIDMIDIVCFHLWCAVKPRFYSKRKVLYWTDISHYCYFELSCSWHQKFSIFIPYNLLKIEPLNVWNK